MKKKTTLPTAELEHITPEIARAMLNANQNNRKLTPAIVDRYARILEAGEWKVNGETVKQDVNGELKDGQHRLAAIEKTGIAADLFVVRGLALDVFDTIDTGKARTSADALFSSGVESNATLVAAIANLAIKIETGTVRINRYIEPHAVRQWVLDHPEVQESASLVKKLPFLGYSPVLGLVHYRAVKGDKAKAEKFFQALETGEGLKRGDPAYALREMLIKNKRDRGLHKADVLAMALKAWNAYINEQALHILRRPLKKGKDAGLAYAL